MLTTSQEERSNAEPLVHSYSNLYNFHNKKKLLVSNSTVHFLVSLLQHNKKWKSKKYNNNNNNKYSALEHKCQKEHRERYHQIRHTDVATDTKQKQSSKPLRCHCSKCRCRYNDHQMHNTHNNKKNKDQQYNRKCVFTRETPRKRRASFESSSSSSEQCNNDNESISLTDTISSLTSISHTGEEGLEEEQEEEEEEEEDERESEHKEKEILHKRVYSEEKERRYEHNVYKSNCRDSESCEQHYMKPTKPKNRFVVNKEEKNNIYQYSEENEVDSLCTSSVGRNHSSSKEDQMSLCSLSTLSLSSEMHLRKKQRTVPTLLDYLTHDMPTELFILVCSYLTNGECCTLLELNHAMLWRMTDVDRFVWRDRTLSLWHNKQAFRLFIQGTYVHEYNNVLREGEITILQLSLLRQYDDNDDKLYCSESNVHKFNSVCAAKGSVDVDCSETNVQMTWLRDKESMTKSNSYDDKESINYLNNNSISSEKEEEQNEICNELLEGCNKECKSYEMIPNNVQTSREDKMWSQANHERKTKRRARRDKRHAKHYSIVGISNNNNNSNENNNNEMNGLPSETTSEWNAPWDQKSYLSNSATLSKRKWDNTALPNYQSNCLFVQSTSHKSSHYRCKSNLNYASQKAKSINKPEHVVSSEYYLAHHTIKSNNVNNSKHQNKNHNKGRNKCKKQKNRVKRRRQRQQRGRRNNKRKHQHHHHHYEHHRHHHSPTYYHYLEMEQKLYNSNRKINDFHRCNKNSSSRHHESKRRGRSRNLGARRCRSQLRSTSIKRDSFNYESKYKQELESHYEEESYELHNDRLKSDIVLTTGHSCHHRHHNRLSGKRHNKKRNKICQYNSRNVNEHGELFTKDSKADNNNKCKEDKFSRLPTRSALRRQRRLRHRARCLSERTTYESYHNRGALLNQAVHKSFRMPHLQLCSDGQCNCATTPTYHAILQSKPVTFANDFEPLINTKCATLKTNLKDQNINKEINDKKVANDDEEEDTNTLSHPHSEATNAVTHSDTDNTIYATSNNQNNITNRVEDPAISSYEKLYKGLYWWQLTPEAKQRYLHELKRFVLSSSKNDNACVANNITRSNSANCVHDGTIRDSNADKCILPKRVRLLEAPSYRSLSELSRAAAATFSACSSFSSSSSSSSSSSKLYSSTWSNTDGRHRHRYRSESSNQLIESSARWSNNTCSEVHTCDNTYENDDDDGNGDDFDEEASEENKHHKMHLLEQKDESHEQERILKQKMEQKDEKYCIDYEYDEYAEREEAMLLTRAKATLIYELKLQQSQTRALCNINSSIENSSRVTNDSELKKQETINETDAHLMSTASNHILSGSASATNQLSCSCLANTNANKPTEGIFTSSLLPTSQATSPPIDSASNTYSRSCALVPSLSSERVDVTNDGDYTLISDDNVKHNEKEKAISDENNDDNVRKGSIGPWEPTSWKFAYFMSIREARRSLLTLQDLIDNTWLICFRATGNVHLIRFETDHTLTVGSVLYNNDDKRTTPFIVEHTSNTSLQSQFSTRNHFERTSNHHQTCVLQRVQQEQQTLPLEHNNPEKHNVQSEKTLPKLYFQLLQGGAVLHVANLQPLRVSRRVHLHVLNRGQNESNKENNNYYCYHNTNNFARKRSCNGVASSNISASSFHAEPVRTLTRINHWLNDKVMEQHKKTSVQEWLNSQTSLETHTAESHKGNTSRVYALSSGHSNNTISSVTNNKDKYQTSDSVKDDWGWTLANATVKIFSIDAPLPNYVNYLRHPLHNRANEKKHNASSIYIR